MLALGKVTVGFDFADRYWLGPPRDRKGGKLWASFKAAGRKSYIRSYGNLSRRQVGNHEPSSVSGLPTCESKLVLKVMITPSGAWCKGSPSYAGGKRSPTSSGQATIAVDDDRRRQERLKGESNPRVIILKRSGLPLHHCISLKEVKAGSTLPTKPELVG